VTSARAWRGARTRATALASALLLLGCRKDDPKPTPPATASATPPAATGTGELIVLAAASLKGAFSTLESEFEGAHPGIDVRFAFAGTQELRRQLESGAQADVMASADEAHMQALVEGRLVEAPVVFAENEPVVVTFAGSATPVRAFSELRDATRIVLGVPDVPIGRYSLRILERADEVLGAGFRTQVEAHVVSRELNVRQVLAKVALGEADAAIVYRSDVTPPQRSVRVVDIPGEINVLARYPIAVVTKTSQKPLAQSWIALVHSAVGRATLESAGLRPVGGR